MASCRDEDTRDADRCRGVCSPGRRLQLRIEQERERPDDADITDDDRDEHSSTRDDGHDHREPATPDPQVWLCKPDKAGDPCLSGMTATVIGPTAPGRSSRQRRRRTRRSTASTCTRRSARSRRRTRTSTSTPRRPASRSRRRRGTRRCAGVRADVPAGHDRRDLQAQRRVGRDRVRGRAVGVEGLPRALQRRSRSRAHRALARFVHPAPADLQVHRSRTPRSAAASCRRSCWAAT